MSFNSFNISHYIYIDLCQLRFASFRPFVRACLRASVLQPLLCVTFTLCAWFSSNFYIIIIYDAFDQGLAIAVCFKSYCPLLTIACIIASLRNSSYILRAIFVKLLQNNYLQNLHRMLSIFHEGVIALCSKLHIQYYLLNFFYRLYDIFVKRFVILINMVYF